jgi:hypothetical protein
METTGQCGVMPTQLPYYNGTLCVKGKEQAAPV